MAEADRSRWDAKHRQAPPADAPAWLEEIAEHLPRSGRALDVACGRGRVGLWLAAHGLQTVGVDISPVALTLAHEQARARGLPFEGVALDLEQAPLPDGPFACIACFHYLQRDLFPTMIARLAPGGVLLTEHHTKDNLRKHAHPSARFLLDPGELADLTADLQLLYSYQGWCDDRALARCVARLKQ